MNPTIYTVKVYEDKTKWFNEQGQLHRLDGLPAIECASGSKFWYVEGKYHRLDGPAREWADGRKEWWVEGKQLAEEEFNSRNSCVNKTVTIDGQEYQLVLKR